MRETIKWIWIILFVIFVMGIISLLPYDKYQSSYIREIYRLRAIPQERVDATYRYIEAVENGLEDLSNGISTEPPKKYYNKTSFSHNRQAVRPVKKYSKPLYIRDKKNPNIWYRYREK